MLRQPDILNGFFALAPSTARSKKLNLRVILLGLLWLVLGNETPPGLRPKSTNGG
jgi:hypothetical protein